MCAKNELLEKDYVQDGFPKQQPFNNCTGLH